GGPNPCQKEQRDESEARADHPNPPSRHRGRRHRIALIIAVLRGSSIASRSHPLLPAAHCAPTNCSRGDNPLHSTGPNAQNTPITVTVTTSRADSAALVESAYAWRRLVASLALSTIGGVGLWSVVVVLPAMQAEFGVARGSGSL